MTYDEWVEQYRPIKNEIADHGYSNTMFETYGEEADFVKAQPDPRCIWTLLDEDGHTWIGSGWHFVNRLGYFVTEVPFEGDTLEITIDGPQYKAELNHGFGWAVRDTEQPKAHALCWVNEGLLNAGEIAEAIAQALNNSGETFDLTHEEDDDLDDEDRCRTEGCDEDPNDGEGFDGYCGNCADRLDQEGAFD